MYKIFFEEYFFFNNLCIKLNGDDFGVSKCLMYVLGFKGW